MLAIEGLLKFKYNFNIKFPFICLPKLDSISSWRHAVNEFFKISRNNRSVPVCVSMYVCACVCVCVWGIYSKCQKRLAAPEIYYKLRSLSWPHIAELRVRQSDLIGGHASWPHADVRGPRVARRSRSTTSSGSITSTKTRTQTQSTRKVTTGTVIEPENYIFQAIFTRRLMADVRAASGVVCGQQWNNLLLPSWAAHHLAKIEPSDMSRVNASHNYTLTRRIGLARLSTMWQESWDPGFAHRPGWKKCGTAGIYRGINANCCGQFTYTHSLVNRSGIENGTGR